MLSATLMEISARGSAIMIEFCYEHRDDAVKDNICENICTFADLAFDISGVEATGEGQTWSRRAGVLQDNGVPELVCTGITCAVLMPKISRREFFSERIGATGIASDDGAGKLPSTTDDGCRDC